MSEKIIVLVSDLDDGIHGEINILESPDQAAHFVESLIESGFEQERIRVFTGAELAMEVHHRPVVSLSGARTKEGSPPEAAPEHEEVAEQSHEEEGEVVAAAASRSRSARMEEVEATPFVKNGVRFSSQFRPA